MRDGDALGVVGVTALLVLQEGGVAVEGVAAQLAAVRHQVTVLHLAVEAVALHRGELLAAELALVGLAQMHLLQVLPEVGLVDVAHPADRALVAPLGRLQHLVLTL